MLYERRMRPGMAVLNGNRWRLRQTRSLMTELDEHGREMARVRGVPCLSAARRAALARTCNLVVKLSGMDFNGLVHLDFAGMVKALRVLAQHGNLNHAVIYLLGWDGPFMRDYPRLEPAEALSASATLREVAEAAHALGATVVLHLNPVAASESQVLDTVRRASRAFGLHAGPIPYPDRDWTAMASSSGWALLNPWFAPHRD